MRFALLAFLLLFASATLGFCDQDSSEKVEMILQRIFNNLDHQTDEWFHEGSYLRSIHAFRMRMDFDPEHMPAYSLGAWLLWSAGKDDEAQEVFQRAVMNMPANYEPFMEAGLHWSGRRDEYKAALWLMNACNRWAPIEAWKMLSHSYRNMGELAEAISVMEHARAIDPSDEMIELNLQWLRESLEGS